MNIPDNTHYEALLRKRRQLGAHIKQLELEIALLELPEKFGFRNAAAFALAFRKAARLGMSATGTTQRKRARITPDMLDELASRAQAGESPKAIADALGIAVQTARNKCSLLGLSKQTRRGRRKLG